MTRTSVLGALGGVVLGVGATFATMRGAEPTAPPPTVVEALRAQLKDHPDDIATWKVLAGALHGSNGLGEFDAWHHCMELGDSDCAAQIEALQGRR